MRGSAAIGRGVGGGQRRAAPAASAARARLPGPPSLTLLPAPSACARRPLLLRPSRPVAAAAGGGAGALPFPSDHHHHDQTQQQQHQKQQQQQQLPFLETVWRNIAAGGVAEQGAAAATTTATAATAADAAPQPPPPAPQAVAPLPPPPKTASFAHVMPYLASLALSERQMWWRLAAAFACMVISKAAGLSGPLFLKQAVDALSASASAAGGAAAATAAAASASATALAPAVQAVLCFGGCSVVQHLAKELQHPAFTPVSQAVARRVAHQCFAHVLDLDIKFHLDRRTGRLSRVLERGTRSVQVLYRAVLFTFAPTAVELCFVVALLAGAFSPLVAGLVGATFLCYVAWTLLVTQMSVEVRKRVNSLDNLATSKAVDALLNAETVALFDNARLEVAQYDAYLVGYQRAAVQTERLSALLNAGQAVILAVGLTSVMIAALVAPGASAAAQAAAAAAGAAAAGATAGSSPPSAWWSSFLAWAVATPEGAARFGVGAGAAAAGGGVTGGDLVLLQGLLLQLWAPLAFLGWFYRELRASLVDLEEFFDVLRTPSSLPDGDRDLPPPRFAAGERERAAEEEEEEGRRRARAVPAAAEAASSPNHNHHHHHHQLEPHHQSPFAAAPAEARQWGLSVELDNVRFGYHPGREVLRGVSLRVAPGESVAIVGPSGSGKSSILRLITRLYDCTAGTVRVGGVDVRDLRRASLRGATAVVPQETVLLNDSLLQNVRYGRPDAPDEDVMAAIGAARLGAAVARMPEGAATGVGERGLKLSGGEKQRVAIARAFLKAPRLLICDEASSALDSATEAAIMAELAELAQGRSCIYVAHRLSTTKGCDRIVVLSEGLVAEEGTHGELLAKGGIYASMWARQVDEAREGGVVGAGGRTPGPEDGADEDDEEEAAPSRGEPALMRVE